jgi:predicted ATPase with chaperone activity
MNDREIDRFCVLDPPVARPLDSRVRKVAHTIADLAGRAKIDSGDVAEAIQHRTLDRRAG